MDGNGNFLLDSTSLNRHFIELISCGDDLQFQELIRTFLPLLIRSIEQQTDDFRKKAVEIFIHINKRLKSRPEIQVPVGSLLEIFTTSTRCSPFASNFSIMYIKLGFMRLTSDAQVELIPLLFQSLQNRSIAHQELLMGLIVYALQYLKLIPNTSANVSKYGLKEQPTIRQTFLNFLLNILLLPYKFEENKIRQPTTTRPPVEPSQLPVNEILFSTMDDAPVKEPEIFKQPYPCMNEQLHNRITEAIQTTDLTQVEKLKVAILKYLNANIYTEDEIAFHFVLATADSRYSVVLAAEHDIKRLNVAVDWNATQHVQHLFEFFLGTLKTVKQSQESTTTTTIRNPSNTRIRLKLYPYLLKSRIASTIFPHAIQVLYESLFGNSSNGRIKYFSLQFAQNIIQNAELMNLTGVSKLLLIALEKVLNTETTQTHDVSRLRSLAYVLIGKLAYRIPKLLCDDIRLTQQFFEALKTEDHECCLHIQEALSLLAYSQKDASVASKHILQQLLTQQVVPNSDSIPIDYPHCRQAAVSYVMNVFPANDSTSRFILLMACSDKNEDIRSLASRNLFDGQEENYPEFFSLFKLILTNARGEFPIGRQILVYHPQTYQEMIYYLHRCLIRRGFNGEKSTPLWQYEDQLDSILNLAQNEPTSWYNYIRFLVDFTLVIHDCLSTYFLLEAVIIGYHLNNENLFDLFTEQLSSFRQMCLFSTRDDTRRYASILYAYVLSKQQQQQPESNAIDELIKIAQNSNQRFEQREGSILALGYVCSYLNDSRTNSSKDLLIRLCLDDPIEYRFVLMIVLGQLARMHRLNDDNKEDVSILIERIRQQIRTSNETNRMKEKSIQTLGFLAGCYREQSQKIIDILTQSLVDTKQIELHLNIGDALVCCILGKETRLVHDPYLILDSCPPSSSSNDDRSNLIQYLFDRILFYSSDVDNPHSRQAAFIWLLTFLIHCRRPYLISVYRSLFESNLFHLQTNLIRGLLDQDELNQELACKCLIYIYEIIQNEQIRLKFNEILFEQFTDKTRSFTAARTTLAFEHDLQRESTTETIQPASSLVLYKELWSLVELVPSHRKSELFYALLYLAHENSIWSTTRYGQLFHFVDYETNAVEIILQHIEQLIARLYRLLYDPQVRVRESIERIWKKLFPKQISTIIDKYFSLIFTELYNDMLSNRWRIRESIQSGLLEIFRISNRKLIDHQQYVQLFGELLRRLLIVCDDTKESVRKVALSSMNSFKQNCLLLACDPTTTVVSNDFDVQSRGRNVLEQVLPILLHDGLYNKNDDIVKFSLNTIIEFVRYGDRSTLKPYCTLIIIALFETLSSIEPDLFNSTSMKLSASEMKEQIDMARLVYARSSPMMDAIQTCTNQYVDEDILDDLSIKLMETIKHQIGLTTKCLVGQYLITLTNLFPKACTKYVGKWMATLVNTMSSNSNRTLRKTYTSVLGTIVRIAKRSSIENLLQKISTWYYQIDGDYQYVCALTLNSIAQSNHEMLTEFGEKILPLIFVAMQQLGKTTGNNEEQQQEENIWQNLWLEHTGSSAAGIQLYASGIIENIRQATEHSAYPMRMRGARAIQMIGETLKANLKDEHLVVLVEILLKGLYGRIYEGKEYFLRAIETISTHCKISMMKIHSDLVQRVYETILKECKKESLTYRSVAIRVLSLFAEEYNFQIYELFWIWLEKAFKQPDPNEEHEEEDDDDDPLVFDVYRRTLIECLPRVWPKNDDEIDINPTFVLLSEILTRSNWQLQLVLIQSITQILLRSSNILIDHLQLFIESIINLGPRTKYTGLKREILKFISIILVEDRYATCLQRDEKIRNMIRFNLDEMIHDNAYHEISEQAKQLKKMHEHFFVNIQHERVEEEEEQQTNMETENLF